MSRNVCLAGLLGLLLVGCQRHGTDATVSGAGQPSPNAVAAGSVNPGAASPRAPQAPASPTTTPPTRQASGGSPYTLLGTQVWDVPDPVSGRMYQVFISLPTSYGEDPARRYPVLYVTDADYAFPVIRQIARRLNGEGPAIKEVILVGLSYAVGEEGMPSRRRDYTPTADGNDDAPPGAVHGQGDAYMAYLRDQVFPFVATRYRTDEHVRIFLGHSYGGLLGTQIMLTHPELFAGYILGSPSYWYGDHVMQRMEEAYAKSHTDLPAHVYLYVGEYEDPRFGKRYSMVSDARRMAQILRSHKYPSFRIDVEVLHDEDHLSIAPRGFTHGLKVLLGDKTP